VYREGLARFCTTPYARPAADNLGRLTAHLTNYAVNKKSGAFLAPSTSDAPTGGSSGSISSSGGSGGEEQAAGAQGAEVLSHKWSFAQLRRRLESEGHAWEPLWRAIEGLVAKSLISVAPLLQGSYKAAFPGTYSDTADGSGPSGRETAGDASAVAGSRSRCFEVRLAWSFRAQQRGRLS
jgi:hypothetical protein